MNRTDFDPLKFALAPTLLALLFVFLRCNFSTTIEWINVMLQLINVPTGGVVSILVIP